MAFKPMGANEAETFVEKRHPGLPHEMTIAECMLYAEVVRLAERVDALETQAQDMMSPDKMMDMAQQFLGAKM